MSKHTPGPWWAMKQGETLTGAPVFRIATHDSKPGIEDSYAVGAWTNYYRNPHEAAANARLIAVAPEMLDSLRAITTYYIIGDHSPKMDTLITTARALIAKVEGGA